MAEMKCEIAYESFRYMTLEKCDQVERHLNDQQRHGKLSFARFVEAARHPDSFRCSVLARDQKRQEIAINGAILVWGSVIETGRRNVQDKFGFADILSVEDVVNDLVSANDAAYANFVTKRSDWCGDLFQNLLGKS